MRRGTKLGEDRIAVLMSTYNGGGSKGYLRTQLDTILNQRDVVVSLFIRDDGSTDDTISIIKDYIKSNKNITLLEAQKNLGACCSFLHLISTEIDCDYFALADQDDIWDEDKLSVGLQKLKKLPQEKPALYYSNLRIVDMNNEYMRLAHSEPQIPKNEYSFLADPLPAGCTCIYNRKLAEIAWKMKPEKYSMHDTWLYNIAELFGNTTYDFEPHINYRQHNDNVSGAAKKHLSLNGVKRQLNYYFNWKDQPRYRNALILKKDYRELMSSEQYEKVSLVANYKRSIFDQFRLIKCKEIEPGNQYRRFRWKLKILLRNI